MVSNADKLMAGIGRSGLTCQVLEWRLHIKSVDQSSIV